MRFVHLEDGVSTFAGSKLDLLVRVRYSNPLPPPPFPPKLLDITTNPIRYSRPEFLSAIANDTPLPMIVDAECGMPLDLGIWECLWDEDADDSGLPRCTLPKFCDMNVYSLESRSRQPPSIGPERSILTWRPFVKLSTVRN